MIRSIPGIAAPTSDTWGFGALPNAVEAPENTLALAVTCACTSLQPSFAAHHSGSRPGESRLGGAGARVARLKESGVIDRVLLNRSTLGYAPARHNPRAIDRAS